jgi:mercuric ion transport protein
MSVELIYDRDCPNAAKARTNLIKALAVAELKARWTEWDRAAPESPPYVKGYGSPTILVYGKDVAGSVAGEARASCRLYRNANGFDGTPSVEEIVAALRATDHAPLEGPNRRARWKRSPATVPRIAFSFLPKVACPACWPAYAGLLSSVGLGVLLERQYLLPLAAGFLIVTVGSLAFRARARRGYGPFAVGLAASVVVMAGKFAFDSSAAMYGSLITLIAASAWNAWPAGASSACRPCASNGSSEVSSTLRKEK